MWWRFGKQSCEPGKPHGKEAKLSRKKHTKWAVCGHDRVNEGLNVAGKKIKTQYYYTVVIVPVLSYLQTDAPAAFRYPPPEPKKG